MMASVQRRLTCCAVALASLVLCPAAVAQTDEASARVAFGDDVHASAALTCESCHGKSAASDAGRVAPSYAIRRAAVAPMCARCHSDAAYMRTFAPQLRIDQYAEYVTSRHGQRMVAGEERVATCHDCHGSHGIRPVRDPRSPVAPVNTAKTCAACHADGARMAAFGREPTPFADWSASVHAAALLTRGDTSAPTCSTCHGSHGATPPGVDAVVNVCSQCHAREAELFRASPKKVIFDTIGEAECLACHGNHRIEHPSDRSIGLQPDSVCVKCPDDSSGGAKTIVAVKARLDQLAAQIAAGDAVLTRAERAGMLVEDGRAALREAADHQIHSRVLVHAFALKPFDDVAGQGLTKAESARQVADEALQELRFRRQGLGVATFLILGFLVTLWWKIRRLPQPAQEDKR
jgi:cytochrome c553